MKKKPSPRKSLLKNVIIFAAAALLVAAYIIGFIHEDKQTLLKLQNSFLKRIAFQKISDNPLIFEARDAESKTFLDYIAIEKGQGWGGPLHMATVIDKNGVIERVILIDHKETPPFLFKIQRHRFLQQFVGKKVSNPFVLECDIDTVTQATMSSKAIKEAVRGGSHAVAKKILDFSIKKEPLAWKFGNNEIILLLLYVVMLTGVVLKIKILRYLTMAAAFIFLGFYLNSSISIGNISSLLLGYFPSFRENMFLWLLLLGALVMPLILRRNLYCSHLCPFGVLQESTAKISGLNIQLGEKNIRLTRYLVHFLTWLALILIFLTSNPAVGAYEPFATFFGLEGIGVQWFILPVVVIGSFVLTRFFCRFFCPVGVVLNVIVKARSAVDKIVTKSKK
ncbi:MAG: 4Fe-4S binding protein [Candidatus Aminicenantales bacterium]